VVSIEAEPAPRRRPWWRLRITPLRSPRRLRIVREGWIFIILTLGVGAAAINTGNNLLFLVLGLLLGLIIVSGVMSELTLRDLDVARKLPARCHANTPTLVEVTLRNRKRRLPSYSIELEDRIAEFSTDKRCYFLKVGPEGKQTAAYGTSFPARGPMHFEGYRVATRYPFGLFEKWREVELEEQLLVYPALVEDPPHLERLWKAREGESSRRRPGLGEELHGLRDHQVDDDVRAIHWRTSARHGRLIVRENEQEATARLLIYVDNAPVEEPPTGQSDPGVERAISLAATLVVERTARGQAVEVSARGERGPRVDQSGGPLSALRFLALLGYAEAAEKPETPFAPLGHGEALYIGPNVRAGSYPGVVLVSDPPDVEPVS